MDGQKKMDFVPNILYWNRLRRKLAEDKCWENYGEDYSDYFLSKYTDDSFKSEFEKALFENDPLTKDSKKEIRNSMLRTMIYLNRSDMIVKKDIESIPQLVCDMIKKDFKSIPQLVCLFLAADSDVNSQQPPDNFALLHSFSKGRGRNDLKIMDILLTHPQVQVNIKTSEDLTPLMMACLYGCVEAASKLAKHPDTDFNCRDSSGWTAVHMPFISKELDFDGKRKILEKIFDPDSSHFDVEVLDKGDRNILEFDLLAKEFDRRVWEFLFKLPVIPRMVNVTRDKKGYTLIFQAIVYNKLDAVDFLLQFPGLRLGRVEGMNIVQFAVNRWIVEGFTEGVELCLRQFSEHHTTRGMVNTKNKDGDPPIIELLKHGRVDLVNILLESPVIDLGVRDAAGKNLETIAR